MKAMWQKLIITMIVIAVLSSVMQFAGQAQEAQIPQRSDYISDYADIVDSATEEELTNSIKKLEEQTGTRILILTLESTKPMEISDYCALVFNKWRLRKIDVLFVVALKDGRLCLNQGDGLKRILPDEKLREIMNEKIISRFAEAQYAQGISQGVAAISSILTEAGANKSASFGKLLLPTLLIIGLLAVAVLVLIMLS